MADQSGVAVWPSPAEAWRTRFVPPHHCRHGLWWAWDRLTCTPSVPTTRRAEARADVKRAKSLLTRGNPMREPPAPPIIHAIGGGRWTLAIWFWPRFNWYARLGSRSVFWRQP